MVKNTHGGSKHKSQARKATTNNNLTIEPTSPLEKYAKVIKMYGNGMCQIETQDDDKLNLVCHIRGKFRGKNKKHNTLGLNSVVVIGLRDWESQQKNCDLIGVVSAGSNTEFDDSNDSAGFTFGNDSNEVYDNVEPQPVPNMDDFDIDDI